MGADLTTASGRCANCDRAEVGFDRVRRERDAAEDSIAALTEQLRIARRTGAQQEELRKRAEQRTADLAERLREVDAEPARLAEAAQVAERDAWQTRAIAAEERAAEAEAKSKVDCDQYERLADEASDLARRLHAAEERAERAERQAAAGIVALESVNVQVSRSLPEHTRALIDAALSPTVGADYVHRRELDAAERRAAYLRNLVVRLTEEIGEGLHPTREPDIRATHALIAEAHSTALRDYAGADYVPRGEHARVVEERDEAQRQLDAALACGICTGDASALTGVPMTCRACDNTGTERRRVEKLERDLATARAELAKVERERDAAVAEAARIDGAATDCLAEMERRYKAHGPALAKCRSVFTRIGELKQHVTLVSMLARQGYYVAKDALLHGDAPADYDEADHIARDALRVGLEVAEELRARAQETDDRAYERAHGEWSRAYGRLEAAITAERTAHAEEERSIREEVEALLEQHGQNPGEAGDSISVALRRLRDYIDGEDRETAKRDDALERAHTEEVARLKQEVAARFEAWRLAHQAERESLYREYQRDQGEIDKLRAEVARLTAERDASVATVAAVRDALLDAVDGDVEPGETLTDTIARLRADADRRAQEARRCYANVVGRDIAEQHTHGPQRIEIDMLHAEVARRAEEARREATATTWREAIALVGDERTGRLCRGSAVAVADALARLDGAMRAAAAAEPAQAHPASWLDCDECRALSKAGAKPPRCAAWMARPAQATQEQATSIRARWERSGDTSWLWRERDDADDDEEGPCRPLPLVYVCKRLPVVGGFSWFAYPPGKAAMSGEAHTRDEAERAGVDALGVAIDQPPPHDTEAPR